VREITGATFYAPDELTNLSVPGSTLADGTVLFDSLEISGEYAGTAPAAWTLSGNQVFSRIELSGLTKAQGVSVLDNVSVRNNELYDRNAVYASAGTMYLNGGSFLNNRLSGSAAGSMRGAALQAASGTTVYVNVRGTLFSGNTASDLGGAVFSQGMLKIDGATFSDNLSVGNGGGALYTGRLAIVKSALFSGNTATNGGAVYVGGGTAMFFGSTFSDNVGSNLAGALYQNGGTTSIANSLFERNSAVANGAFREGATLRYGGGEGFNISGSTFTGNTGSYAGALYISSGNDKAHFIRDSYFYRNAAIGRRRDRRCDPWYDFKRNVVFL